MAIYRLTNDNFDKVLLENNFMVVDFWADWCTTCTSFSSIYEQISESYPTLLFAKVNTQLEQNISVRYRIQSIPTLIVFHKQVEIFRKPGAMPGQQMITIIDRIQDELSL